MVYFLNRVTTVRKGVCLSEAAHHNFFFLNDNNVSITCLRNDKISVEIDGMELFNRNH